MPRVGSSRISNCGFGREPAREQRLLLVAARQLADRRVDVGRLDAQRLDEALGQRRLLVHRDEAPQPAPRLQREA
jgi:hypothetical protein